MHCRAQPAERLSAAHAGRRHRRADRRLRRLLRARPWMRRRLIQRAARERVVPAGSAHFPRRPFRLYRYPQHTVTLSNHYCPQDAMASTQEPVLKKINR